MKINTGERTTYQLYIQKDEQATWNKIVTLAEKMDHPVTWVIWKLVKGEIKL